MPLRISIEFLLIIAALAFVASLAKAGQSTLLCVLLYTAIIFHPLSFYLNNYVLSDVFYASILLLGVSCLVVLFLQQNNSRRLWYATITGVTFTVLLHTRHEGFDVFCSLAFFILIVLFKLRRQGQAWSTVLKQTGAMALTITTVIWIGNLAVKTLTFTKFGAFATTSMTAPGFSAAHRALLRIKPATYRRFVPIPQEVRNRAYAVSPAFRELEPYLEGEFGRKWRTYTPPEMGVQDEIVSGWFAWALHGAGSLAANPTSAGELDAYFQRVADEINAACDDGRLPSQWVFSSFLDPHVPNYLPYLPSSFLRLAKTFTSLGEMPKERDNLIETQNNTRLLFDAVANRRNALTSYGVMSISGWAVHIKDPLQKVCIHNHNGQLECIDQFSPRPDVANYFIGQGAGAIPTNTGYHLSAPLTSSGQFSGDIVFITQSGREYIIADKIIAPGRITEVSSPGSEELLRYNIEAIETSNPVNKLEGTIQRFIWSIYGPIVRILTYLSLVAVFILLICYRIFNPHKSIYAILAILGAIIIARVALFTLIDASSFPCSPRFLYPVMHLYTCVLLIFVAQSISIVNSQLSPMRLIRRTHSTKN